MTLKDYENRLENLIQQLKLVHLYRAFFLKSLGSERAIQDFIDQRLDEINEIKSKIEKLKNNRNG